MRQLSKSQIRFDVLCLLSAFLPVVISAVAFLVAQTEPGSILPVEATLRHNPMDNDLMNSVNKGITDVSYIKMAFSYGDPLFKLKGFQLLITEYFDPFVLLSLMFGNRGIRAILLDAYFIRFGLAGLTMYRLLSRRIKGSPYFNVMMSVLYSVCSISILSSGTISGMNLVILLPLMYEALDEASCRFDRRNAMRAAAFCTLVFISGLPGLMSGLFAAVTFVILISILRHPVLSKATGSVFKLASILIISLFLSGIVNMPRFYAIQLEELPEKLFKDGNMSFKLFDLLTFTSSGITVRTSVTSAPAVYFGIIGLALVIILMFNRNIPLRVKAALSVTIVIYYICSSYTPIARILAVMKYSAVYSGARMAGMMVILVVAAVISAKNLRNCSKTVVYGSGFAIMALVAISNSSENVFGFYNYQLFMTFISAIAVTVFLVSEHSSPSRASRIIFGIVCFMGVTANISYLLMMSDVNADEYGICIYPVSEESGVTVDDGLELSVFTDENSYIVIPMSFEEQKEGQNVAAALNDMSSGLSMGVVFEPLYYDEYMNIGFIPEGDDYYSVNEVNSELVFGGDWPNDEPVYVCSGINTPVKLSILDYDNDDPDLVRDYSQPFLTEINHKSDSYEVSFIGGNSTGATGEVGVYTLDQYVLASLNAVTGTFEGDSFTVDENLAVTGGTSKALVTGLPYDCNKYIYINGKEEATFNYMGKLAVRFVHLGGPIKVRIGIPDSGILFGFLISAVGAGLFTVCSLAISKAHLIIKSKKLEEAEHA